MSEKIILTTSTHLEGYRVVEHLNIVRGITVRSRGLGGNIAGGFMSLFGGKSAIYTELCENSRAEALNLMLQQAESLGANAVICMRYESNEVLQGMTEVLAYGTAVRIEKI